jgi:hypothetical protein
MPMHGVIVVCFRFCERGAHRQICCLAIIVVVILFSLKKKILALSSSLVVVTMGLLHIVSERVQLATWELFVFH